MSRPTRAPERWVWVLLAFLPPCVVSGESSRFEGDGTELAAKVDAIARKWLEMPGAAGLSIAVGRQGEVLLARGYGLADLELEAAANAETMFRIGSVTKQFTAAAILRFVERGDIGFDDDLSLYLPGFSLQGRQVTIRQLLNHTSGIKSYTNLGPGWSSKWPMELSHSELLALVEDQPFDFEPGTSFAYNNTGYYLLGMVLEEVSGKSYAELLQEELFEPLKLARTRYDSNVDLIKNRAQGYAFDAGTLRNDQVIGMSQPGAAGALISTAQDLVRWQIALTSGKIVSSESFESMCTSAVLPDGRDTRYGFGLFVDELAGRKRIQHGGGIFGFNSILAWYPEADVHVAVISNSEALPSGKVADEIASLALGTDK